MPSNARLDFDNVIELILIGETVALCVPSNLLLRLFGLADNRLELKPMADSFRILSGM